MRNLRLITIAAVAAFALSSTAEAQQLPRWLSKFSVHGYLSQAYAVSDEHQIFGIPTGGTTDYRDLALQLRYDQDPRNVFVVQFRQERFGESPLSDIRDDVELDWAFYQRKVSDSFSFKAGRIPLPLGIFNEARGAGTTFPFFRPSNEFYEGEYTSKTLEGVLGSFSMNAPRGWSVDADAYFGQWTLYQRASTSEADARNAFGGQLWLNTPVSGVRLGAGAYRCTVDQLASLPPGASADYLMVHASVEADLDRWLFAVEYLNGDLDSGSSYDAYYVQGGVYLTRKLSVHARAAVAELMLPHDGLPLYNAPVSDDLGLAFNYAVHPALLLKVEGHTNEGLLNEEMPHNIYAAPVRTRYLIASIAATF
jgi:hypothetical protein